MIVAHPKASQVSPNDMTARSGRSGPQVRLPTVPEAKGLDK